MLTAEESPQSEPVDGSPPGYLALPMSPNYPGYPTTAANSSFTATISLLTAAEKIVTDL